MNNHVPNEIESAAFNFKFEGLFKVCILWFILAIILCFAAVVGAIRDGWWAGVLIVCIFIVPLLLVGVINVASLSDIIIDDGGICRSFFGLVWHSIRWNNVSIVKEFETFDRVERKMRRGFGVYPINKPRFRLMPSGKIFFGEKVDRPDKLICLLNKYISEYGIKVSSTVGGVKSSPERL